jgi:hypothetical protein
MVRNGTTRGLDPRSSNALQDGKKEEDFEGSVFWREGLFVGFTPPIGYVLSNI